MPPTPYRRQRDRRRADPMNYRIGPRAAVVQIASNDADPSNIQVTFNCDVDASQLTATNFSVDGFTIAGPFVQAESNVVQADADAQVTPGGLAICRCTAVGPWGPNVTGDISVLFMQEQ